MSVSNIGPDIRCLPESSRLSPYISNVVYNTTNCISDISSSVLSSARFFKTVMPNFSLTALFVSLFGVTLYDRSLAASALSTASSQFATKIAAITGAKGDRSAPPFEDSTAKDLQCDGGDTKLCCRLADLGEIREGFWRCRICMICL